MKITDEMVKRACVAYSDGAYPDNYAEHEAKNHRHWMRLALMSVLRDIPSKALSEDRWEPFTDEEVAELLAGAHERSHTAALPKENVVAATALRAELTKEQRRRRSGYQGPGVYRSTLTGKEYDVLGWVNNLPRGMIVLREPGKSTLTVEDPELFNHNGDNHYVRPLGES